MYREQRGEKGEERNGECEAHLQRASAGVLAGLHRLQQEGRHDVAQLLQVCEDQVHAHGRDVQGRSVNVQDRAVREQVRHGKEK